MFEVEVEVFAFRVLFYVWNFSIFGLILLFPALQAFICLVLDFFLP